jgi:transposase
MSGVTHIEIQESAAELAERLQGEIHPKLKERLQVLYLLALPQAMSISAVARVVGKHRATLQRWLSDYQQQGLEGLMEIQPVKGRPRIVPAWAVERLKRRLAEPEGCKSYGAVQQWLSDTLGIEAAYATVYHLVRYRLKAKLKVARPVHLKQNASQRAAFQQTSPLTLVC